MIGRPQDLLPQPQRQCLTPLPERRELQALKGALVSSPTLVPGPLLPTKYDHQAAALHPFQCMMLLL